MFWFILGGFVFIISLVGIFKCCISDEIEGFAGAFGTFIIGLVIIIATIVCALEWYDRAAKFEVVPQIIANKVEKIKEMRKTYYNPPDDIQFNIDMVNKDLAININNEIKDLERYINDKNDLLASWCYKYRMRFWFPCFVKPPANQSVLLLKNYLITQ